MSQSSNSSEEVGNSSSTSRIVKKQISPAIGWCLTFNNYTEEKVLEIQDIMQKKCKIAFFNKEVGEKCGTPHLQGYLEFHTKNRPLNMFPSGMKWIKARGNKDQNFKYCSKECYTEDMTFSIGFKKILKVKIITELYPFQQEILDMLLGPVNEGKIIWIYDPVGQLGKTEMVRYLNVKYGIPFTYGGKANDIINLVFNQKDYLIREDRAVMIYNFCRSTENDKISYKSMEQISDGCISNNKFETGCFVCNKPHVIVFANCLPIEEALTQSRWIIKTINKDLELIDYKKFNLEIDFMDDF